MKIKKTFLISLLGIFFISLLTNAQGCSDAGFCTINGFKPIDQDSLTTNKNHFKVGATYGSADYNITIFGNYIEYGHQINEKISVEAKLTSLLQDGNGISAFGLSDIYLNANYKLTENARVVVGTKLPLTDGNAKENGSPLPMDYQSSLGTVDLIIGFGYQLQNLQLVAALQQPLTQNSNAFFSEIYPEGSVFRNIQTTNEFERSGDVLVRVSYPITVISKLKFTPSILPIYHLANDKYTDILGNQQQIDGSQGLTLNGNAYLDYQLNNTSALQLNIGMPFVVRDERPDGLTRSLVVNLEYKILF
jgi:hypothetical protein